MNTTVFITRYCKWPGEVVCIYGVYSSEDKAKADLPIEEQGLKFDESRWIWINRSTGRYYRIDEFTVN